MKPIRAFFAISLPDSAIQSINLIIQSLQATHKHESIRWTHPAHLHITLQFLPALQLIDLPRLMTQVRSALHFHSHPLLEVELKQLELFPTAQHPRVITLAAEPQTILAQLAKIIGDGITACGYPIETRPFRGHLTLARLNHPQKDFSLTNITLPTIKKFPVHDIILYRSEPSRQGSLYTPLERLTLDNINSDLNL